MIANTDEISETATMVEWNSWRHEAFPSVVAATLARHQRRTSPKNASRGGADETFSGIRQKQTCDGLVISAPTPILGDVAAR